MNAVPAVRLVRIEMVCGDPEALAAFYQAAFGFQSTDHSPAVDAGIALRLGNQTIHLIGAGPDGRTYPAGVAGWSLLFQHIAIVVTDMALAYAHLSTIPGWTPISTSGPQLLPLASGGVSAFKFRDPEGHPLELLAFPPHAVPPQWQTASPQVCLGIDHSAISVANTAASTAFYQGIGLRRSGGSLNVGPAQARLDDVPEPAVEVTALNPAQATPHVELLCYRGEFDRRVPAQSLHDIAATRLVLTVEDRATLGDLCARASSAIVAGPVQHDKSYRALLRDPDGHLIWLEAAA